MIVTPDTGTFPRENMPDVNSSTSNNADLIDSLNSKIEVLFGSRAVVYTLWVVLVLVRVIYAQCESEVDEIWSYEVVSSMKSLSRIFSEYMSNNHLLNSIMMYLLKDVMDLHAMRFAPFIFGICGSFFLVKAIADHKARLFTLFFLICSLPIHIYSTQLRGYTQGFFFATVCYWAMTRILTDGKTHHKIFFALSMPLMFLSHAATYALLPAFFLWGLLAPAAVPFTQRLKNTTILHVVPVISAVVLYAWYYRHLVVGGGPVFSVMQTVLTAFATNFGGPIVGTLSSVYGTTVLIIFVASLYYSFASNNWEWVFVTSIPVFTLLIYLKTGLHLFYVRSLFFVLPFQLVAVSKFLANSLDSRIKMGIICGALCLCAVSTTINLIHLEEHDWHYKGATQYLYDNSRDKIVLTSDQGFPLMMMVNYYLPNKSKKLEFYSIYDPSGKNADFLIKQTCIESPEFVPKHVNLPIGQFDLVKEYHSYGFSEWSWHIYRRTNSVPG